MRFTRAAKVAAFPLIVLALVALVACQGGPGTKGDKGDKGDTGTMGTPGTMGDRGTNALQARTGVAATLLNPAHLVDADGRDSANAGFAGMTKELEIALDQQFTGGVPDYTYSIVDDSKVDPNNILVAKVDGDLLKYTITRAGTDFMDEDYATPVSVTVRATDSQDVSADAVISILLNQAPTGQGSTLAFTLGTSDANRETPLQLLEGRNAECMKINECVLDVFDDNGKFTVSVTGMTQGGKAVSDLIRAVPELMDDGTSKIKLIGMASADGADKVVTVNLKATDDKGLWSTASVIVNVDEAPKVSTLGEAFNGSSHNVDESLRLTAAVSGWFEDEDTNSLTYGAEPANDDIAAVPTGAITAVDITGVALGQSTEITVTVTEDGGLGQSASVKFSVTVTGVKTN